MVHFIRCLSFGTLVFALGLGTAGCGKGTDTGPAKDAPPPKRNMEAMQKKIQEVKQKYGRGGGAEQAEKDKDKDKENAKDKDKDEAKEKDKKE